MLAAVIAKTAPWYQRLAFNWFDVAIVALLIFGFWRGQKRGMTKELFPTLHWVAILLGAGLGHVILADWYQHQGYVRMAFGNHFNERTAALMSGYLTIAIILSIIFTTLKRKLGPKIEASNFFGGNEYYWGVVAGLARYLSLLLVGLALLNAPVYSAAEIAQSKAYRNNVFGAGLKEFSGDYIPTIYEVQDAIFKHSFMGPIIRENLSILLINSSGVVPHHAHS